MTDEKPLTIEGVKRVILETQRHTSTAVVQAVVVKHGGKIRLPSGDERPMLRELPAANFVACVAELKALFEAPKREWYDE